MPEPPEDADLIVIGAGVNGAAVARDAVLRGLRTVLVDAEDLSAGTSSTSSRLIHGGIRYLEHGEVRLVRESLRERERLLHAAPHLVAPYGLLIPFYQHNRRSPRTLRLGMVAYDVLSADKTTPHHRVLSAGKVQREYPGLDPTGLQGAALYFDAQVPYAERLSVEQAVDAAAAGATVLTHWRVTRLRRGAGSVNEVSLRDELTQTEAVVPARAVVNAAGPWVDDVLAVDAAAPNRRLVRGSKGSHFAVARFPGAPPTGVHYEARSDARAILVLPVDDDRILIGSTDIFEGDPGDAVCSDEEIDYLLGEVNQLIPTANLGPDDVLHSYAGVRPLPHTPAAKSTAEVSRDHHVVTSPGAPGLFSVVGGKLTTHRALGELAVDKVLRHLESSIGHPRRQTLVYRTAVRPLARTGSHSPTRSMPLPGGRCADWTAFAGDFSSRSGLEPAVADRLLRLYGVRAARVRDLSREDAELAQTVPGTGDVLAAEVALAMNEEFARTLTDVMARRLVLVRRDDVGLGCARGVAQVCGRVAGWSERRVDDEVEQFQRWTRRLRPRAGATQAIGRGGAQWGS